LNWRKFGLDKECAGVPNCEFLAVNDLKDGIIRKDTKIAKLTEYEIDRNKKTIQDQIHS
jgi:hypothetical protein